jgi:hypothetical protein
LHLRSVDRLDVTTITTNPDSARSEIRDHGIDTATSGAFSCARDSNRLLVTAIAL